MSSHKGYEEEPFEERDPEPISGELEALADALIDYSLDLLGETGELAPTLAVEDEHGERVLLSFDDEEDLEECLDEIRGRLAASASGKKRLEGLKARPVRYAIAYDGAVDVTGSGAKGFKSALIIEYGEQGLTSGYSAYMLYKKAGKPREFTWTDPEAAGECELLV